MIVGDAFARPLVEAYDQLDPPADVSPLTVVLSGGAVLSPAVKAAWVDRLPGTFLIDGFGASETGGQGQSVSAAGGPIDARRPLLGERRDHGARRRPAPGRTPGVVGKLARRGHVPLGYYKDPEKSAATFPVIDGVRWSVPGDHARIEDDGTITVLGRGSVSINTGGEKVYPEEVEAALKSHARGVRRRGRRRARRTLGRAGHRGGAGARRRDPRARRARRARPRAPGVVQGTARPGAGRHDRALAVGQARLPLGRDAAAVDRARGRRRAPPHRSPRTGATSSDGSHAACSTKPWSMARITWTSAVASTCAGSAPDATAASIARSASRAGATPGGDHRGEALVGERLRPHVHVHPPPPQLVGIGEPREVRGDEVVHRASRIVVARARRRAARAPARVVPTRSPRRSRPCRRSTGRARRC